MTVNARVSSEYQKPSLTSREIALSAIATAIGQKARDVRGLDLIGLTDIADCFVIASGNSDRHVKGIADRVKDELRAKGELPITVVGYENAEWVLLDYGNVIVHIFHEPVRQFYNLDALWNMAHPIELDAGLAEEARRLRTGMF